MYPLAKSAVVLLGVLGAAVTLSPKGEQARAPLHDVQGKEVGSATFRATPIGVLVHVELTGLPAGWHGVHVHAVGKCEPPFASAGSHWDQGGHHHGFLGADGGHAGDLPNVNVGSDGTAAADAMAPRLALSGADNALDADGAALVVHAGPDDYTTDPSGSSGGRIACGVLEPVTP